MSEAGLRPSWISAFSLAMNLKRAQPAVLPFFLLLCNGICPQPNCVLLENCHKGHRYTSHWNRTAFFAKRQDKERLLLYSSLWGVFFLGLSFLLSILVPYSDWLTNIREWWAFNTPPIQFSGISSCALTLGAAGQFVLNRFWPFSRIWNQQKEGRRAIETYGTELEKLLYRSLIDEKRVMLTLKNGKVYIGRVTISLSPQEDRDLMLLPSKSGYRDEKQRLMLTTDYDQTYRAIVETEKDYLDIIADFGVTVPIPEVLTVSLYREEVHTKYFHHEDPPDTSSRQLPSGIVPSGPPTAKPALGIPVDERISKTLK